jgi:hypothetical protein
VIPISAVLSAQSAAIVAEVLTHGSADDERTALDLIDLVDGDIASFAADAPPGTDPFGPSFQDA